MQWWKAKSFNFESIKKTFDGLDSKKLALLKTPAILREDLRNLNLKDEAVEKYEEIREILAYSDIRDALRLFMALYGCVVLHTNKFTIIFGQKIFRCSRYDSLELRFKIFDDFWFMADDRFIGTAYTCYSSKEEVKN